MPRRHSRASAHDEQRAGNEHDVCRVSLGERLLHRAAYVGCALRSHPTALEDVSEDIRVRRPRMPRCDGSHIIGEAGRLACHQLGLFVGGRSEYQMDASARQVFAHRIAEPCHRVGVVRAIDGRGRAIAIAVGSGHPSAPTQGPLR